MATKPKTPHKAPIPEKNRPTATLNISLPATLKRRMANYPFVWAKIAEAAFIEAMNKYDKK